MKTASRKKKAPSYAALPCGATLLSLDVSSSVTGWCVGKVESVGSIEVIDFGLIVPTKSWPSTNRIEWMWGHVLGLINEHKPTRGCFEWQSHKSTGKKVQGLAVLGQAQGFMYAKVSAYIYTDRPSEREWTNIGGKNLSKKTRFDLVKAAVPEYTKRVSSNPFYDPGLDAADAIGLAIWRVNQGL